MPDRRRAMRRRQVRRGKGSVNEISAAVTPGLDPGAKPVVEPGSTKSAEPAPAAPAAAPRHVFLIDGSGFIFRAYFARARDPNAERFQRKSDGMPTEVVMHFSNMLDKHRRETDADRMAVIFDAAGASFRNRIYDQYKANRREMPDDLIPQLEHVRRAADAFDICRIEMEGFEADDLIATYARQAVGAGAKVTILSSDKDLMQLVSDKVTMKDPMTERLIGDAEVREKFGVGPDKVIDVQALCGDSIDNVPGVPGIGVKTAAELINTFGDLETLLARVDEIKQPKRRQALIDNEDKARLSKVLVKLDDDVPVPCPLSALEVKPYNPEKLFPFLDEMELRALKKRIVDRLSTPGSSPGAAPPASAEHSEPAIPEVPPFTAPKSYALVETLEGLDHWIEAAGEAGIVAIWPEASKPAGVAGGRPALAGVALAVAPGLAAYVPLAHLASPPSRGPRTLAPGSPPDLIRGPGVEAAIARLKPLFEDPGVLKICHDAKGAARLLRPYGVALGSCDCTMLMSYVLDGGQFDHAVESLVRRGFAHELTPRKELVGTGKSLVSFAEVPAERARDFAAERADAVLRLHMRLKARLLRDKMTAFYETIERPLVPVVAAMEDAGIKVDRAALAELSRDFAGRIAAIEAAIFRAVGHDFNIGSTKQLGDVLFEKLGLPGGKKGKTGAYGTDASILEELAPLNEVPRLVLEWRQLTKLKSTYADALAEQIDGETGRVHTSYALAATATGRFSSTEPNLQNIPVRTEEGRRIRRAFVAEPGHLLLSADYSQIELRLAAHVADIPELRQAFRDGLDIHALTASQVFGVPLAAMDPLTRRRAKAINFGIIYGISAFGLGQQIGVPQAEAAEYIRAYFARFPAIRAYMERVKSDCRSAGYVETIFGRKCFILGIRDAHPGHRAAAERQAINAPLQGSAADIIRRAMARIPPALSEAKLAGRMLLQVHDELLFEVPEAEVDATAALVKTVMEGACAPRLELSVPLVVETGHGKSWDAAH
jgi:DNA polymerase I